MNLSNKEERKKYICEKGIFPIRVPMPLFVDHTNAYYVEGPTPILIDAGFNSPDGLEALSYGLKKNGKDIVDVGLVLLTHGHRDHFGLAGRVREISGAKVFVHESDFHVLAHDSFLGYLERVFQFYEDMGVSTEKIEMARAMSEYERSQDRSLEDFVVDGFLSSTDEFDSDAGKISIFETPGHSMGSVSFLIGDAGLMFSGDIISASYDPPPLVIVDREGDGWINPYELYMDSLIKIQGKNPKILLPGHGGIIGSWESLIKRIFTAQKKATERIEEVLKVEKKLSVADISEKIYPDAIGPVFTLALNVVRGIIGRFEREGKVENIDGRSVFRLL